MQQRGFVGDGSGRFEVAHIPDGGLVVQQFGPQQVPAAGDGRGLAGIVLPVSRQRPLLRRCIIVRVPMLTQPFLEGIERQAPNAIERLRRAVMRID